MQLFSLRLGEKPLILVIFFSVEQAKPTEELSETYKLEFRKGDNFRSILTKMPWTWRIA